MLQDLLFFYFFRFVGAAAVAGLTEAVAVAAVGAASARVLQKSGGRNMSLPKLSERFCETGLQ